MSSYYIFEGYSTKNYDMKTIESLKNGLAMPWTFYTVDLKIDNSKTDDKENGNFGIYNIIYTSQCKCYGFQDRLDNVTEISKYEQTQNGPAKISIKNPTINDYEAWGWPLEVDPITKEKKKPLFGTWVFKKDFKIDYENKNYFNLIFVFGFGLRDMCYNFADEIVKINIFNLSTEIDIFYSESKLNKINFNDEDGTINKNLTKIKDSKVICDVEEGNPETNAKSISHLYIPVENNEQLELDVSVNNGLQYQDEIEIKYFYYNVNTQTMVEKKFRSSGEVGASTNKTYTMQVPEFKDIRINKNINPDQTSIIYDFYYLQVYATNNNQSYMFNNSQLKMDLKLSTKSNGSVISDAFNKTITLVLNIKKALQIPQLITNTSVSNMRSRIIINEDEAINMAIKTNNKESLSFIKDKSLEVALTDYKKSVLYNCEKFIDDIKLRFKDSIVKQQFVYFLAMDMSELSKENNVSLNDSIKYFYTATNTSDPKGNTLTDLSHINQHIAALRYNINFFNNYQKSISNSNPNKKSKIINYQTLLDSQDHNSIRSLIKITSILTPKYSVTDPSGSKYFDNSGIPDMDRYINCKRGWQTTWNDSSGVNDVSQSTLDPSGRLFLHPSTILSILFFINQNKTFNKDTDKNNLLNLNFNNNVKNLYNNISLDILIKFMWKDTPKERPHGFTNEMNNYMNKITPRSSYSAVDYINSYMSFKDINTGVISYGLKSIHNKSISITSNEILRLLYPNNNQNNIKWKVTPSGVGNMKSPNNNSYHANNLFFKYSDYSGTAFYYSNYGIDISGDWVGASESFIRESTNSTSSLFKKYKSTAHHKENIDFSGIFRVEIPNNGKYVHVYINDTELVESSYNLNIPLRNANEKNPNTLDLSGENKFINASDYNALKNDWLKSNNNTNESNIYFNNSNTVDSYKFNFIKTNNFKFYRLGSVIHIHGDYENLDNEKRQLKDLSNIIELPKIKLSINNQKECTETYTLNLLLKDVSSNLSLSFNSKKSKGINYIQPGCIDITRGDNLSLKLIKSFNLLTDLSFAGTSGNDLSASSGVQFDLSDVSSNLWIGKKTGGTTRFILDTSSSDYRIRLHNDANKSPYLMWPRLNTNPIESFSIHKRNNNKTIKYASNSFTDLSKIIFGVSPDSSSNITDLSSFNLLGKYYYNYDTTNGSVYRNSAGSDLSKISINNEKFWRIKTNYSSNTDMSTILWREGSLSSYYQTAGGLNDPVLSYSISCTDLSGVIDLSTGGWYDISKSQAYKQSTFCPTLKVDYCDHIGNKIDKYTTEQLNILKNLLINETIKYPIKATDRASFYNNVTEINNMSINRWTNSYIDIDLMNQLEPGEKFKIKSISDYISYDHKDYQDVTDKPCQGVIKYTLNNLNDWETLDSNIEFEYKCYKKLNDPTLGKNFSTTDWSSNNVKDLPKFRLYLPNQSDLIVGSSSSFIKRVIKLQIFYTKHSVLTDGVKLKDGGNKKEIMFDIKIDNIAYDINAVVEKDTYKLVNGKYKKDGTKIIYKKNDILLDSLKNVTSRNQSSSNNDTSSKKIPRKVVTNDYTYNDKKYTPNDNLYAYDFSGYQYNKITSNDKQRSISLDVSRNNFVYDLALVEGHYGNNYPLCNICIDNLDLKNTDKKIAKVEIVPLFNRHSDFLDYQADKSICNTDNDQETTLDKDISNIEQSKTNNKNTGVWRYLPANTNYTLVPNKEQTQYKLIRKTSVDYNQWISPKDYNFYDEKLNSNKGESYYELVACRITYVTPTNQGYKLDKTFIFLVNHINKNTLTWKSKEGTNIFDYTINEGANNINIGDMFTKESPQITIGNNKLSLQDLTFTYGVNNLIEYRLGGYYDSSGKLHYRNDCKDLFSPNDSGISSAEMTLADNDVSGIFNLSWAVKTLVQNQNVLIKPLVNDDLYLFIKDYINNKVFDYNIQMKYTFIIETYFKGFPNADLTFRDLSNIERSHALVNIYVKPPKTQFSLVENSSLDYYVTETLGLKEESTLTSYHNPDIYLYNFLKFIRHKNYNSWDLVKSSDIKFEIIELDTALQICENPDPNKNKFWDKYIKLKDDKENYYINATKEIADFPHYDYERVSDNKLKNEYNIKIRVSLSNYIEIIVKKTNPSFVCNPIDPLTGKRSTVPTMTCTYLIEDNIDLHSEKYNNKLFYFKDPETSKYQGPLSLVPHNIKQINDLVTIDGYENKKFNYAIVRSNSANNYLPLYKTKEFTEELNIGDVDKETFFFKIKVADRNQDSIPICPQPYLLKPNKCDDFFSNDPLSSSITKKNITVEQGDNFICNVYQLVSDIKLVDDKLTTRLIHMDLSGQWRDSTSTGRATSATGLVNKSVRSNIGTFFPNASTELKDTSATVIGFFVEQNDPLMSDLPMDVGERIDYSGTNYEYNLIETNSYVNKIVPMSNRNLYTAKNVRLHQLTNKNSYYAKGQVYFNDRYADKSRTYNFTVTAVTNILATKWDMSMNKHMCDTTNFFDNKRRSDISSNGDILFWGDNSGNLDYSSNHFNYINGYRMYPRYCYDGSLNRIVTHEYATKNISTLSTGDKSVNKDFSGSTNSDYNYPQHYGTLLCCRSHICVDVNQKESNNIFTVTSDGIELSRKIKTNNAISFNLNSDLPTLAYLKNNVIHPKESIPAKKGDTRVFRDDTGKLWYGYYENDQWRHIN